MIVDHIKNHAKYMHLSQGIQRAMEYLGSTDFTFVESGQYELDGKNLVSIVNRYKTKLPGQAVWESHRKYIDVQFVAGGEERFGHVPLEHAPAVKMPYSSEKDVIFYEPGTETFAAPTGTFMIFYPDDIHAPSLAAGTPPTPGEVVKVVVKVAV
jgi:biofilm protein TabA